MQLPYILVNASHKRGPMQQVHWVKRKAFGADPQQLAELCVSICVSDSQLYDYRQHEEPVDMSVSKAF